MAHVNGAKSRDSDGRRRRPPRRPGRHTAGCRRDPCAGPRPARRSPYPRACDRKGPARGRVSSRRRDPVDDQKRGLAQQLGRAERVKRHQRVQRPSGDLVAPVRRAGPGCAVVGERLVAPHRGLPAVGRHRRQVRVVTVKESAEGRPVLPDAHRRRHLGRAVVAARDPGDRPHPRVLRRRPDGVAAAKADSRQPDPRRIHLGPAASALTAARRSASFPWLSSCWRRPPLSPKPR